jgi:hypothetical protein
MAPPVVVPSDAQLVEALLKRLNADLRMMLGRELAFGAPRLERAHTRPAGQGAIHISFKLAFWPEGGAKRHGALLMPLPSAITMACFLLMMPEETVTQRREETTLDPALKDAMLEIGNMIGGATNTVLAELGLAGWSARSLGCQGVRADVRPAFPYQEGSELVVARIATTLEPFSAFELLLLVPVLG